MHFKTALIIGRFQPFHLGHLYLLKKTLKISDKVKIAVGSATIYDENNPLDYKTREQIIKAVFYKEKSEDRLLNVVPLDDFPDDKEWLSETIRLAGDFDVVVSNNEWTVEIMKKAGFLVKQFPYFKRSLYEGWRVRELIIKNGSWQKRVPDYLINYLSKNIDRFNLKGKIFDHIVFGGTFDHLHKGHRELINTAFRFGRRVTVGIATKELFPNKVYSQMIESLPIRKRSVKDYIEKNHWIKKSKIIEFSEFTGGIDKRADVDAIVVSRLSYRNALKINKIRQNNGLGPLRIVVSKDILADDGKLIASERIRKGEIDREGRIYLIKGKKDIIIPERVKEKLRKPLGKVFRSEKQIKKYLEEKKPTKIICVGDVVVKSFLKVGIRPDVKIIDFRSRRKSLPKSGYVVEKTAKQRLLRNEPGTINIDTARQLKEIISATIAGISEGWVFIEGEEDLLVLPSVIYAPLGAVIFYGHWQYGVIALEVTEEVKKSIREVIIDSQV
ncbi:hypothetical protein B6D29_03705 [Microgenomates bacterium UTCPR1]|nr:MAG: hypothetical protein B6D29_03705 [Microgenomates bacterium UTCPR1]